MDDDIASRWGPRVVDYLQAVVDAVNAATGVPTPGELMTAASTHRARQRWWLPASFVVLVARCSYSPPTSVQPVVSPAPTGT